MAELGRVHGVDEGRIALGAGSVALLQMLFQADMGRQDAEHVRRTFWAEHGATSAEVRGFADDFRHDQDILTRNDRRQ